MIPFEWWPGSWGLKGKTRAIAKAEYELEGYELEVKLAEIHSTDEIKLRKDLLAIDLRHNRISDYEHDLKLLALMHKSDSLEYKKGKLDIEFQFKEITEYDYDKGVAELKSPVKDQQLALLDVDLKHERITPQEYERKKADVLEEPWIAMPKIAWDPIDSSKTYFELDYNDFFLVFLRDNGYQGSDDECINRWLNDVCYSVLEEMDQPEPEMINTIRKIRLPDGKTEHS